MRPSLLFLSLPIACWLLSGCSLSMTSAPTVDPGLSLKGKVQGGQQPIVGAHVYLFAANTTGYGSASVSLLNAGSTGNSDAIGAYVLSDANGNFTITGDYSCTPNTQVYLYALGGNPGSGVNSAAGLLAALGNCPSGGNFLTATPSIFMNEVSTVATAYAIAGFATDAIHVSSSGTALAQVDIANAFLNVTNLEDLPSGTALAFTPNDYGQPPQSEINTLANILAACVNSTGPGSTACGTLLSNAMNGSTTPKDTATAAINMAHNPIANVANLYALSAGTPPFAPALTVQPNDFSMTIQFTSGGGAIAVDASGNVWWGVASLVDEINSLGADVTGGNGYGGNAIYYPQGLAFDLNGNLWAANYEYYGVTEISSNGTLISGPNGFATNSIYAPYSIAMDTQGNAWIGNGYGNIVEVSNTGNQAGSFTSGGLANPVGVAIDPSGNVWAADYSNAIIELSSAGVPLSGTTGYTGGGLNGPTGIAIDHAGNIWTANNNNGSVTEMTNTGTFLSGATGYAGNSLTGAYPIAIDGSGNAWVSGANAITELSPTGVFLSGSNGFESYESNSIAVDGSGDVWTNYYNYNSATGQTTWFTFEMIGAATPVVTPLVVGVKNNTLGTRP